MIHHGMIEVSASPIRHTEFFKNYQKFDGLYELTSGAATHSFGAYSAKKITAREIDPNIEINQDLISDEYKILWAPNIGLYNLYYCTFSQLLQIINDDKNVIVYINKKGMHTEADMPHFTFILDWLDSLNIKYKFIEQNNMFYAKNFYKIVQEVISPEMIDEVYKFGQNFVDNKDVKPFRKVYVSRRHIPSRDYFWIKPGLSSKKDDRLIDHEVIESFLESKGFEIVIPEQKFTNFKDQINYFYETKMLVSLSSSGISNALFMQPNTTIVEFMTTYPAGHEPYDPNNSEPHVMGSEMIHHLYHAQAYLKNHTYIAVPNITRYSNEIIDKINNSAHLSYLIGDRND